MHAEWSVKGQVLLAPVRRHWVTLPPVKASPSSDGELNFSANLETSFRISFPKRIPRSTRTPFALIPHRGTLHPLTSAPPHPGSLRMLFDLRRRGNDQLRGLSSFSSCTVVARCRRLFTAGRKSETRRPRAKKRRLATGGTEREGGTSGIQGIFLSSRNDRAAH